MDIRCRKVNCMHNDCSCCDRLGIQVSDTSLCKNFKQDKTKKGEPISKTMFEKKPKIAPFKHCQKFNIDCKADCLFNQNGKCNANGITVLEEEKNAPCGTFFKKPNL